MKKTVVTIVIAALAVCALAAVLILRFVPLNVTDKPYTVIFEDDTSIECTYTGKWIFLGSKPIGGVYTYQIGDISVAIDDTDSEYERQTYTRISDNKVLVEVTTPSETITDGLRTVICHNPNGDDYVKQEFGLYDGEPDILESSTVTFANGETEELKINEEENEVTGSDKAEKMYSKIWSDIRELLKDVPGFNA